MIVFDKVNFSYGKDKILNNFSLNINEGDTICLFAPSGFGKTTILRLIMGLEKVSSGTVSGLDDKNISVVFQEDRLLPTKTVLENVELFANAENTVHTLERLGLEDAADMYPSELSGGMARRTAIARALCRNADIYIFDEPFNGIDHENIEKTAEYIKEVTTGKILILVTHDREQAELLGATVIDISKDVC